MSSAGVARVSVRSLALEARILTRIDASGSGLEEEPGFNGPKPFLPSPARPAHARSRAHLSPRLSIKDDRHRPSGRTLERPRRTRPPPRQAQGVDQGSEQEDGLRNTQEGVVTRGASKGKLASFDTPIEHTVNRARLRAPFRDQT